MPRHSPCGSVDRTIKTVGESIRDFRSLPVRECGLKPLPAVIAVTGITVTPRAGVWIETLTGVWIEILRRVTPRAGVWIETLFSKCRFLIILVTPRAGVWIETIWKSESAAA